MGLLPGWVSEGRLSSWKPQICRKDGETGRGRVRDRVQGKVRGARAEGEVMMLGAW